MKRTTPPLQIAATLAAWLMLTASLTTLNILIGLGIALLLPPLTLRKTKRSNLIAMLWWEEWRSWLLSRPAGQ